MRNIFGSIMLLLCMIFTIVADSLDNFARALEDIAAGKKEKKPIKKVDVNKVYTADEIKKMIQHALDKPDDKENFRKLNEAFKQDTDFDPQDVLDKMSFDVRGSALSIALSSFEFAEIKKLLQHLDVNPNTYAPSTSHSNSSVLARMVHPELSWWANISSRMVQILSNQGVVYQTEYDFLYKEREEIIDFLLSQESVNPNTYLINFLDKNNIIKYTPLALAAPLDPNKAEYQKHLLKKLLQHPRMHFNEMLRLQKEDVRPKEEQSPYLTIVIDYEDARKNKTLKEFLKTYEKASDDEMEIVFRRAIGLYDQEMLLLLNQKDPQKYSYTNALLYALSVNQAASIPWLLAKLNIKKDDLVYILGLKEFVQQKGEFKGQKGFESKITEERKKELDPIKQAYAQAKENNFKAVGRAFENYRGILNLQPVPEEVVKEFIIPV